MKRALNLQDGSSREPCPGSSMRTWSSRGPRRCSGSSRSLRTLLQKHHPQHPDFSPGTSSIVLYSRQAALRPHLPRGPPAYPIIQPPPSHHVLSQSSRGWACAPVCRTAGGAAHTRKGAAKRRPCPSGARAQGPERQRRPQDGAQRRPDLMERTQVKSILRICNARV